jgi:hypothetical protein
MRPFGEIRGTSRRLCDAMSLESGSPTGSPADPDRTSFTGWKESSDPDEPVAP